MSFLDAIRDTIARYHMLQTGDRVGVAVSGGADSTCLLHVFLELQAEFSLDLAVVHIDHGIRGAESREDAQFVHNYAQRLGLPFHLRTVDLHHVHGNLEQEARRVRYDFFRELMLEGAMQKIATGHTRSDQAETVLYRLLRGAGSAGLAGIRPITDAGVIRPLLQVSRPQVETWLTERAIPWRQDATNADLRFDRNRLRCQLIPFLEANWNPGIQDILAQTADWAWEEEQFWQPQIQELVKISGADALVRAQPAGRLPTLVIDLNRLNSLPVATARRFIREIVRQLRGDLLGISFAQVQAVLQLASAREGCGKRQIAGLEVLRSLNWLRFAKPECAAARERPPWQVPVTAPGRYTVPPQNGNPYVVPPITFELELISNEGVYNGSLNALDGEKVAEKAADKLDNAFLRNWRAGDSYRRQGHAGDEKLKKLFAERRVPSWDRLDWPILTVGGRIAWASEFGPAAEFAVNAKSRKVLMIHASPQTPDKV